MTPQLRITKSHVNKNMLELKDELIELMGEFWPSDSEKVMVACFEQVESYLEEKANNYELTGEW